MNIGIPKERRTFEFRVGMTPLGVRMLAQQGHTCYIEHDAGKGAGFADLEYEQAGGRIVYSCQEAFGRADLLVKVARPLQDELEWLRPDSAVAGLLHLGSTRQDRINTMLEKNITAIAYDQIRLANGTVPVRRPMSQISGTLAAQISARLLQNNSGGKGILLGGIPGVPPAEVVIIGAGVFGWHATRSFVRMGAHVTVLDVDIEPLQRIYNDFPGVVTLTSNPVTLARVLAFADVVVAAVLVEGERPPTIITREMVRKMKERSVIMDISIDEGGCVETSRPTTHEKSYFMEEGVIHYCVPNIASVVARTASYALMNAAFPFIEELANRGVDAAIQENPAIELGTAIYQGEIRHLTRIQVDEETNS